MANRVGDGETAEVRDWISSLGPGLSVQAQLLDRLLTAVEADSRWEWLELGCSVADGRGDALSDLDVGVGHTGEDPPPTDEVTGMLRSLSQVIDMFDQPVEGALRWWVQYADGGQLDLVVMPAARRSGTYPRSVVLLDRRGRLTRTVAPSTWAAAPEEPRRWLLDGWEAMSNVAKYLQRGSLLEAVEQIHRARTRVMQLWAVGEGVAYPIFGLTSLIDDPGARLPTGVQAMYPTIDRASVLVAATATGRLLHEAGRHAQPHLDTPLRQYVTTRLDRLTPQEP